MAFKVQIGSEEVYIEDLSLGGAGVDVPPEHEPLIRALAETHPGTREPSEYEEGLLLTFVLEEDELPFRPFYYHVNEAFIRQPGEPERFFSKGGDSPA
jgi:hypothetical protein